MNNNTRYPIRTNVGRPIALSGFGRDEDAEAARVVRLSAASDAFGFSFQSNILDLGNPGKHRFDDYLPKLNANGSVIAPATGLNVFERPEFASGDKEDAVQLSAISKPLLLSKTSYEAAFTHGRKASVELLIRFARPALLGGACVFGNPYIPYTFNRFGQSSANFGLPREIQITNAGAVDAAFQPVRGQNFFDADNTLVHQESNFHSGANYIPIEPTYTSAVILRLSNFPFFAYEYEQKTPTDLTDGVRERLEFTLGYDIPQLVFYTHEEAMRYRPLTGFGLLSEQYSDRDSDGGTSLHGKSAILHPDGQYGVYSAASLTSSARSYRANPTRAGTGYKEIFVSEPLGKEDAVDLLFEQADDEPRCVAGLKMRLPFIPDEKRAEDIDALIDRLQDIDRHSDSVDFSDSLFAFLNSLKSVSREALEEVLEDYILQLPNTVNFCESVQIEVFEVDPPEGLAAARIASSPEYLRRIARTHVSTFMDIFRLAQEGVRFDQPTSARHLLIRLSNADSETCRIVVSKLEFFQSSDVWITPRLSKSQTVQALHFRLIGKDLLDDYAVLGSRGFTLGIERVRETGQRQKVAQFKSLLDLLNTTKAQVFQNSRRRSVEFEKSVVYTTKETAGQDPYGVNAYTDAFPEEERPNYALHITQSSSQGYIQTEMGPSVSYTDRSGETHAGFESRGSQEVRSHTEHLYPTVSNDWEDAASYVNNARRYVTGDPSQEIVTLESANPLTVDFQQNWGDLAPGQIEGLHTLTFSPFSPILSNAAAVQNNGDFLRRLFELVTQVPPPPDLGPQIMALLTTGPASSSGSSVNMIPGLWKNYLNGFNISPGVNGGINVGIGFGASLGTSSAHFWPGILGNHSFGSQGSIQKAASRSTHAFSKQKKTDGQDAVSYAETSGGESKRVIERKAVPSTDLDRIKGNEVVWQGQPRDIIVGTIPLGMEMPALANQMRRGVRDALAVRFGSDLREDVDIDIWYDVSEAPVWDDN